MTKLARDVSVWDDTEHGQREMDHGSADDEAQGIKDRQGHHVLCGWMVTQSWLQEQNNGEEIANESQYWSSNGQDGSIPPL